MTQNDAGTVLQQLRWLFCAEQNTGLSDSELLERFLQQGDEMAFAGLVKRHGRLVLGVCRRVLHHVQDAEDVFQATFVILARKATSIRRREAIGSWLYQTAYRLAHKVRSRAQRQRVIESQAAPKAATDPLAEVSWRELREMLDEELARLADKYRAPLLSATSRAARRKKPLGNSACSRERSRHGWRGAGNCFAGGWRGAGCTWSRHLGACC